MSVPAHLPRLQEVAELNPPLDAVLADDDVVSFLPMSAVDAESVDVVDAETRRFKEVSKGYTPFMVDDVLVAKITPCFENGKIALAKPRRGIGFGSTEFHVIRAQRSKLDPRYLVHFLRQERIRKEGEHRMTGSAGQRRVPEHFLANLPIRLPPLPEQRRIAEILDKADALRAKRRAALKKLDELTQSIFLDMFGDPATNPKGWPRRSFDEAVRDETSRSEKLPQSGFLDSGRYPVVDQGQAAIAGYCDDERFLCRSEPPVVVFGDHTRAVKLVREPFVIGADGAKVLVPQPGLTAEFLSWLLRLSPIPDLGYSRHMREVKRLSFPVPPLSDQERFANSLAEIDKRRRLLKAAQLVSDSLFLSLQQRAFQGDL